MVFGSIEIGLDLGKSSQKFFESSDLVTSAQGESSLLGTAISA